MHDILSSFQEASLSHDIPPEADSIHAPQFSASALIQTSLRSTSSCILAIAKHYRTLERDNDSRYRCLSWSGTFVIVNMGFASLEIE